MAARVSRGFALAVTAAMLAIPWAVAGAGPAPAAELGQYNVAAAAQGAQLKIDAPNFLVVESAQAAVPAAQAAVSSVTGSSGFASVPYPGQDIVALPQTANGLTGLPLPAYPLYVGTSYPSSLTAKIVGPAYSMHATSSRLASSANGSGGASVGPLDLGSLKAAASARETTSGVASASSNSDVYGIDIGGVLRIGEVHATASAIQNRSGKLVRSSSLDVAQTTIAGVGVDLTPKGLTLGKTHLPISASNPLSKLLATQRITVQYVAPRNTKHGVISAGVALTMLHTFPKSFPDLGGVTATLSIVLGSASASADSVGAPSAPVPGGSPTGDGAPSAPSTGGSPGGAGTVGSGSGVLPTVPSSGPAGGQTTGAQPPQVSQPASQVVTVASTKPFGVRGVYLFLVLAAAVIFIGGTLWRLLGVRILWT